MRGAASEPISRDADPSGPGEAGLGAGPIDARLDTDLDRLPMARWVLRHHPQVQVDFALDNRRPSAALKGRAAPSADEHHHAHQAQSP